MIKSLDISIYKKHSEKETHLATPQGGNQENLVYGKLYGEKMTGFLNKNIEIF